MPSTSSYASLLDADRVRDDAWLLDIPPDPPEIELQALWFAGEYGRDFTTLDGRHIRIVQFGVWNREAGPDFLDAAIEIDGQGLVRGSIELEREAADWERHGHSGNPGYESVILHVSTRRGPSDAFIRTPGNRQVPQILVGSGVPDGSAGVAPLPLPARPGRCVAPLRELGDGRVTDLLQTAALFRLRRKAGRLGQLAEIHGPDEALFQALAITLGYKENKLPFSLLAQRIPLKRLLGEKPAIEPLLFGLGGFLEEPDLSALAPDARGYVRSLWEQWWQRRGSCDRLILPPSLWRLGGMRPQNHPQRRVAALAALASRWKEFRAALDTHAPQPLRKFFSGLDHPYWSNHFTLASKPAARPIALVGETRLLEMLANVLLPWHLHRGLEIEPDFLNLPARLTNRTVETAAIRLFASTGNLPPTANTLAGQQGLLQIYQDFCLADATDCARCPFPEKAAAWPGG